MATAPPIAASLILLAKLMIHRENPVKFPQTKGLLFRPELGLPGAYIQFGFF
jgi:hypothetical protein